MTGIDVHVNPAVATGVAWPAHLEALIPTQVCGRARDTIRGWSGYAPTPLHDLSDLAEDLRLGQLSYKDESGRFGQGSFKALGGAYGVLRAVVAHAGEVRGTPVSDAEAEGGELPEAASLTVATASDGNHGRAVAWGARRFGCRCVVYLHESVSHHRRTAITDLGAEVVRVEGSYDDAVRRCARDSAEYGWRLVADTASYPDATGPRDVMAGYTTLVTEILEAIADGPPATHVVVPGGVGGLAAAVIAETWRQLGTARPRVVVVEPALAACLTTSARAGRPTPVAIRRESLMAGLSCGEVSVPAWPIVHAGASAFVTLEDAEIPAAMRRLARRRAGAIVAGESGAAGIAMLLAVCQDDDARRRLGLASDAHPVVIGTEGATDPAIYRDLTGT